MSQAGDFADKKKGSYIYPSGSDSHSGTEHSDSYETRMLSIWSLLRANTVESNQLGNPKSSTDKPAKKTKQLQNQTWVKTKKLF